MIANRQKEKFLNIAIKELLQGGKAPSLGTIFREMSKDLSGKMWGNPFALLRPATPDGKIGGTDGKDIENTYNEIAQDVEMLFDETTGIAEASLSNYQIFNAQETQLKRKITKIIGRVEGLNNQLSSGAKYVFSDTFIETANVDLIRTTAEIDVEEGVAVLPRARSTMSPIDCSNAVIREETIPVKGVVYSKLENIFKDTRNTLWQASLKGGTYTAVLSLIGVDDSTAENYLYPINGLYIDPATLLKIAVEWSNDGYNYYPLIEQESIHLPKTWGFNTVKVSHLKLIITGEDVGIKRLTPMVVGYENAGILETVDMVATDIYDTPKSFSTAILQMDKFTPQGTDIQAYIDYGNSGIWQRIDDSPLSLEPTTSASSLLTFIQDAPSGSSANYYHSGVISSSIIEGTESLIKGTSQVKVEYFNYDWDLEDDKKHLPTAKDWAGRKDIRSGYLTPVRGATFPDSDPLASTRLTTSVCKPLVMCPTYDEGGVVETADHWLVVAIKGVDGRELLTPKGNYRFTTYIHSDNDVLLKDMPCMVYNPAIRGGTGNPTIAPFQIALNEQVLLYSTKSYTSLEGAVMSDYHATYSIKQGWNKLEVYVYYPGGILETGVASSCIGLYISPNCFNFDSSLYKVQATQGSQTKVTEFALRNTVPPGNNNVWAWREKRNMSDPWTVKLNYKPGNGANRKSTLDGRTLLDTPSMLLMQQLRKGTAVDSTIRLRFEFSKSENLDLTPKLLGYNLLLN